MTVRRCLEILKELQKGAAENSQSKVMAEYADAFQMAIDAIELRQVMEEWTRAREGTWKF